MNNPFVAGSNPAAPTMNTVTKTEELCPNCGRWAVLGEKTGFCKGCALPQPPKQKHYLRHCWRCGRPILSTTKPTPFQRSRRISGKRTCDQCITEQRREASLKGYAKWKAKRQAREACPSPAEPLGD